MREMLREVAEFPRDHFTACDLFAEPLLAALGWPLPSDKGGELTPAIWPADTGLPPAYLCTWQGARRFMMASTPAGHSVAVDPTVARLLRRRAWSAGIPVAMLVDVDAVAVYDTRMRCGPQDAPHVGRRLHVARRDLGRRWEDLATVLGRQAVQSGAFDAFAYSGNKRRITARQAFVSDVKRWQAALGVPPSRARAVLDGVIFLAMAHARGLRAEGVIAFVRANDIRAAMAETLLRATQPWGATLFAEAIAHIGEVDGPGLRNIVTELFNASAYDLAWLPDDTLGQVYETSLAHAGLTRPAAHTRKGGGVYYTPAPVVAHIVRHIMRRLPPGGATARILDPACGAGAFLVEVYRALLDATLAHYLRRDPLENPRLVPVAPGLWRLSFTEKCRILTTHIFGVDIDPIAVAVTQRALLLALLAGESQPAFPGAALRPLPDLDANIRCGNMLIGPDFGADDPNICAETKAATRPFDWRQAFPAVATAGGFDAVVGNPPYGVAFTEAQKAYIKKHFAHQGDRTDSYLLFMELCLRELIRPNGFCGLVIPNPWLTNIKQRALRRFVLENAALEQIVHFGCAMFKSRAVVDTQIVLLRRRSPQDNDVHTHLVRACEPSGGIDLASATTLVHEQAAWLMQPDAPINIFVDETRRALAAKIAAQGPPVTTRLQVSVGMKPYQVGKGRPKQTRSMVTGRIYDAERPAGGEYRRYLRGADIRRFMVAPVRERYIRYGPWLAEMRTAANFDAPAKLVLRQTGDRLVAAIDEERRVCMNNMHVLTPKDAATGLEGFLGVFNSRLMNWYYQVINPERGEALAEVKKYHVERLPVPDDDAALAAVGACAREAARWTRACAMLKGDCDGDTEPALQQARAGRAACMARLDARVYALFQLTDEEIAIIAADAVD